MTQSPASLFITILELIMLNHIPDYAMKKELFLDLYRGLCIHNPSLNFPTLPEGYFASLYRFVLHLFSCLRNMKALLRQCFFISIITEDFALKRTTNYALPDWEKSDFILMSDFNDLTHKLDTALKSHDDTLNTKADTSAVTAVQQEVAATREANCLVKLAGPLVTTAANAAMEFDLSQVDMTKVAALFVLFSAGGSGEIKLSANDTVVSTVIVTRTY